MKKILRKWLKKFGFELFKANATNSSLHQLKEILDLLSIDIVFDIGANEGQFAKEIRDIGYKGKIVSFEPLSSARQKLLKASKKDNKWIIHNQLAIGNYEGEIEINISGNSVSSSILPMLDSHKFAAVESSYVGSEVVPISKLDSLINQYIEVNSNLFFKIDTQGYEWQVIEGAPESLKKVKGLICELSLVPLYSGQKLWREILDFLEMEGFSLWAIQKGFTDPRTGQSLQIDAIFIKKDLIDYLI